MAIAIVNTGAAPVVLSTPTLAGAGAQHFTIATQAFASPLPAFGQTLFDLAFDPSAAGSHAATVNFLYGGLAFTFSLSGTGTATGAPGVAIADASISEGNAGSRALNFTISISTAPAGNIDVTWSTANDTAAAGTDYSSNNGVVTFTPTGPASQTVVINVLGDTVVEANEKFFVNLTAITGAASIVDSQAIGTILDDDSSVEITMRLTGSWSGGFNADLEIKNKGTQTINGWTLIFDFVPTMTSMWSGSYTSSGGRYTVTPATWNTDIPVGGTATPGFTANGTLTTGSVSNATFNGSTVVITVNLSSSGGGGGGTGSASPIDMPQVDGTSQAVQVTINLNTPTNFTLSITGVTSPAFTVATNNPSVVTPSVQSGQLSLTGIKSGRAGLRISETSSGATRYIGVRVRDVAGTLPGMPGYIAMGSVSEDTTPDLTFWKSFEPGAKNKRIDYRYIYLNGGPTGATEPYNPTGGTPQVIDGWYGWAGGNGNRARNYIRESRKLGIIPAFVYYNIASGNESYQGDLTRIRDKPYMEYYYQDLKKALDIAQTEAGDDLVMFIFEPDFLGYMAQNHLGATGQPIPPNTPKNTTSTQGAWAEVSAAYSSGVLSTAADPVFPDTFRGLVESINYIANKYNNVVFGWQMNVWAYPAGGFTGINPPVTGIMHHTDPATNPTDFATRRQQIYTEAQAVTQYYVAAGVAAQGADFISIDKYGLDAGQQAGAPSNPASSTWFWNADHWNNYLRYCRAIHDEAQLPVVLWQIPVGRVNSTTAANPYATSGTFPDLPNTTTKYEDSAPTFLLGDTFNPGATGSNRFIHFTKNLGNDSDITSSGSSVTWNEHINEAKSASIIAVLFGAGVGISTDGVGDPPTEDYWWITKIQQYYQNPVSR